MTATEPGGGPASRAEVRELLGLTGPLTTIPDGVPGAQVARFEDVLVRELVLRADDVELPCLYLTPDRPPPWSAAVAVHQHANEFTLGKSEPAGLAGDPEMAYGLAMARLGVATVVPDLLGFEQRRGAVLDDAAHERLEAFHLLAGGGSLQARHTQDVALCVSWLTAQPEVRGRVGLIGHSLGGQVAFFTAACDERVGAAVLSCGVGTVASFHRESVLHNPAWYVPGILRFGDTPAVATATVGQQIWVSAGRHDPLFPLDGVREVVAGLGAAAAHVHLFDGGHSFPAPVAGRATRWLESVLVADGP